MPRILSDVLRDVIRRSPDLQVVAELSAGADIDTAVTEHMADVVVGGPGTANFAIKCGTVLQRRRISIIELDPDGRRGVLTILGGRATILNQVSRDDILGAIRSASGPIAGGDLH
jgi:hypothetical protein